MCRFEIVLIHNQIPAHSLRRRVPRAEALHSWRGTFHPISLHTKTPAKPGFDVLVQLGIGLPISLVIEINVWIAENP